MRREALVTLGVVFGATAMLWLVFWVMREWPDIPECYLELTRSQEREVDAFQRGYGPLHAAAGLAIVAAIWRLSAARGGTLRPGRPTLVLLALFASLFVASIVAEEALAIGMLFYFFSFVLAPLTLLLALVALGLLVARRTRGGATLALVVAWLALVVVLPSHFAGVAWVDEPFCMS